jgi:phage tail-like protein
MPEQRDDPYLDFNFLVEIDGVAAAGFSEVDLPAATIEVVTYRDGADKQSSPRSLPGRVAYDALVLRRGFAGDATLFEWWTSLAGGTIDRRDVAVVLLDEARNPAARWLVRNAWPTRYEPGTLDALGNDVVVETLVLAHEGIRLE